MKDSKTRTGVGAVVDDALSEDGRGQVGVSGLSRDLGQLSTKDEVVSLPLIKIECQLGACRRDRSQKGQLTLGPSATVTFRPMRMKVKRSPC